MENVMQYERRGVLSTVEAYIDMLINLGAIVISYLFIKMINWGEEIESIYISHPVTIIIIFGNVLCASFVYHILNFYKPNRYLRHFRSFPLVFKGNFIYFGALAVITTFVARPGYRQIILFWILFSAFLSTSFLTFKRHVIRLTLQLLRKKRYHLRRVIIVGDNTATAQAYVNEAAADSKSGVMIIGYVGDKIDGEALGLEKLGAFKDLERILDKQRPTDAVFAIDAYDKRHLIRLVNMCDDRCVKVYFLPVIYGYFKNSRQIEQVGSTPLINIHSTPLDNPANAFIKRAVDIIGASLLIILTSPVMIAAAIGVRLSSPGPILFKQRRVGKMGKRFMMLKFRSMRVNDQQNKIWSNPNDSRKTRFGAFIRRTAIDELPQLFNVLSGNMSLVGPRPEIPAFVAHFKENVPLYMIKHYVKPGITGLAQIKGFRGDTSIEARIHEDIKYIENWSLGLDIYILLKTPLKAVNKSERYVDSPNTEETDPKAAELIKADEADEREEAEREAKEPKVKRAIGKGRKKSAPTLDSSTEAVSADEAMCGSPSDAAQERVSDEAFSADRETDGGCAALAEDISEVASSADVSADSADEGAATEAVTEECTVSEKGEESSAPSDIENTSSDKTGSGKKGEDDE